jgi:aryl-alcohol dehydrogenase-like predicted oxidoreductase
MPPERTSSLIQTLQHNREFSRRITLGTAQLGQNYGIANLSGKPSDAEAAAILSLAAEAGISYLDTARTYGDSEARIGRLLPPGDRTPVKIITKLKLPDSVPDEANGREIRNAVDANVYGSCRDLARKQLDVVMLHHAPDMFRWNGAAIDRLQELVDRSVICALGISVYSPSDAIQSLLDKRITHIQIPFNLLDSRWLKGEFPDALAQRPDVLVHVRSVFLQGLLINHANTWPAWFAESQVFVQQIEDLTRQFGRKCRADLCMAYVRSFPWVSTLVLGVETCNQLHELLSFAAEPLLAQEQISLVHSRLAGVPARLLNPGMW